jgi:RecA-family ATPase
MDVIANITIKSPTGVILHQDTRRYVNASTAKGESSVLKDLTKLKKDLQTRYYLDIKEPKYLHGKFNPKWQEEKDKTNTLSVTFHQEESKAVIVPHAAERRQLITKIGKLDIDTLREIDLIYC